MSRDRQGSGGVAGFQRATHELSDMDSLLRAMGERRRKPRPDLAVDYVPPRDALETDLVGVWREVLGVERIGVRDRWLELGGQSLAAVRMLARVAEDHGTDVALDEFFQAPTVEGLGRHMREGETDLRDPGEEPFSGSSGPLSTGQERLWFLNRLHPGDAGYNIFLALRVAGRPSVAALEQAFAEVVRRHEILRTVFLEGDDGRPRQLVGPDVTGSVARVDLTWVAPGRPGDAEGAEVARRLGRRLVARPFDLAAGPLIRFAVVRFSPRRHLLVLCLHHIVADGWSVDLLQRELLRLYRAYSAGGPSPLPPLRAQYRDHVARQAEDLRRGDHDRQLDHWRRRLGPAVVRRPPATGTGEVPGWLGARAPVELSEELTRAVELFGRRRDSSLFMMLLTAFSVALAWSVGRDEVLVGSPVAGRSRPELTEMIGFFVNTIVLRVELGDDSTFDQLAARVREEALGAYAASAVPFERVVSALGVERDHSRSPLFDAWLVLQDDPARPKIPPGLGIESDDLDLHLVRHELALDLARTPRGIRGGLFHREGGLDAGRARLLADGFARVLAAGVERPQTPLGELTGLLDDLERDARRRRKSRFKSSLEERLGGLVRRPEGRSTNGKAGSG